MPIFGFFTAMVLVDSPSGLHRPLKDSSVMDGV